MGWFKRMTSGIRTPTTEKKETPEGLWNKCPQCKEVVSREEHTENLCVCAKCGFHDRIDTKQYFEILFDKGTKREMFTKLRSVDVLAFRDKKAYTDRLAEAAEKTGEQDAIRAASGKINGMDVMICCMDFNFIGGSMGSVVGEKISRAVDSCMKRHVPLIIVSKSGGARMMESSFSLMQMAKTSARLAQLHEAKIPYISVLTDPTTGGVSASFAMLGDLNIAEPGALIGFAGPRVVRETIGKDLPDGFQRSEFLLDHGFLDFIVRRSELKEQISLALKLLMNHSDKTKPASK